jgi:hypothetical protein
MSVREEMERLDESREGEEDPSPASAEPDDEERDDE